MKTIDEILERNDYSRMTENLKERVDELAKKIRRKMTILDLIHDNDFDKGEIGTNDVVVAVKSVRSKGFGEYEFLAIKSGNDWPSLEDIGKMYYYTGDFSAPVQGASNHDALRFLNHAKELIKGLADYEDKKSQEIERLLEETKDL